MRWYQFLAVGLLAGVFAYTLRSDVLGGAAIFCVLLSVRAWYVEKVRGPRA